MRLGVPYLVVAEVRPVTFGPRSIGLHIRGVQLKQYPSPPVLKRVHQDRNIVVRHNVLAPRQVSANHRGSVVVARKHNV